MPCALCLKALCSFGAVNLLPSLFDVHNEVLHKSTLIEDIREDGPTLLLLPRLYFGPESLLRCTVFLPLVDNLSEQGEHLLFQVKPLRRHICIEQSKILGCVYQRNPLPPCELHQTPPIPLNGPRVLNPLLPVIRNGRQDHIAPSRLHFIRCVFGHGAAQHETGHGFHRRLAKRSFEEIKVSHS